MGQARGASNTELQTALKALAEFEQPFLWFLVAFFTVAAIMLWRSREDFRRSPKRSFIAGMLSISFSAFFAANPIPGWDATSDVVLATFGSLGVSLVVFALTSLPIPDESKIRDLEGYLALVRQGAERYRKEVSNQRALPDSDPAKQGLVRKAEGDLGDVIELMHRLEFELRAEKEIQ